MPVSFLRYSSSRSSEDEVACTVMWLSPDSGKFHERITFSAFDAALDSPYPFGTPLPRGITRMKLRLAFVLATLSAIAQTAFAASPNIAISQIYGSGGNNGANFRNDYIELFNRGTS